MNTLFKNAQQLYRMELATQYKRLQAKIVEAAAAQGCTDPKPSITAPNGK